MKGKQCSGMEAVKTMKELPTVQVTQENVEQFMQKYLDCTEDPQTNSRKEETDFLNEEVYGTLTEETGIFFSL